MKTLTKLALALTILTSAVAAQAEWVSGQFPRQRHLRRALLPHALQRHSFRQPELSRLSIAATGLRLAPSLRVGFQLQAAEI